MSPLLDDTAGLVDERRVGGRVDEHLVSDRRLPPLRVACPSACPPTIFGGDDLA